MFKTSSVGAGIPQGGNFRGGLGQGPEEALREKREPENPKNQQFNRNDPINPVDPQAGNEIEPRELDVNKDVLAYRLANNDIQAPPKRPSLFSRLLNAITPRFARVDSKTRADQFDTNKCVGEMLAVLSQKDEYGRSVDNNREIKRLSESLLALKRRVERHRGSFDPLFKRCVGWSMSGKDDDARIDICQSLSHAKQRALPATLGPCVDKAVGEQLFIVCRDSLAKRLDESIQCVKALDHGQDGKVMDLLEPMLDNASYFLEKNNLYQENDASALSSVMAARAFEAHLNNQGHEAGYIEGLLGRLPSEKLKAFSSAVATVRDDLPHIAHALKKAVNVGAERLDAGFVQHANDLLEQLRAQKNIAPKDLKEPMDGVAGALTRLSLHNRLFGLEQTRESEGILKELKYPLSMTVSGWALTQLPSDTVDGIKRCLQQLGIDNDEVDEAIGDHAAHNANKTYTAVLTALQGGNPGMILKRVSEFARLYPQVFEHPRDAGNVLTPMVTLKRELVRLQPDVRNQILQVLHGKPLNTLMDGLMNAGATMLENPKEPYEAYRKLGQSLCDYADMLRQLKSAGAKAMGAGFVVPENAGSAPMAKEATMSLEETIRKELGVEVEVSGSDNAITVLRWPVSTTLQHTLEEKFSTLIVEAREHARSDAKLVFIGRPNQVGSQQRVSEEFLRDIGRGRYFWRVNDASPYNEIDRKPLFNKTGGLDMKNVAGAVDMLRAQVCGGDHELMSFVSRFAYQIIFSPVQVLLEHDLASSPLRLQGECGKFIGGQEMAHYHLSAKSDGSVDIEVCVTARPHHFLPEAHGEDSPNNHSNPLGVELDATQSYCSYSLTLNVGVDGHAKLAGPVRLGYEFVPARNGAEAAEGVMP